MKPRHGMQVRSFASVIVIALLFQTLASAQEPASPQATGAKSQSSSSQPDVADTVTTPPANQSSGASIPDSPGTVQSRTNQPQAMTLGSAQGGNARPSGREPSPSQRLQAEPANASGQAPRVFPGSNGQLPPEFRQTSATQASAQSQQQTQRPHEPVGTAAAESIQITGVAASRPAGAAVAPAKQRRVRSILIKVGALVGAGVAVGTTMALSQGSPSKPPGSH
jgi:hypothetical protein